MLWELPVIINWK
ncbi:Protein of unknown function [Lactobacillus acidophilus DSM 9126]|nr:Protein of unknown function [Lactobacillus acidophilus DSM 20079 = JCM 1132 = NBRC 13951 = CIP 76.13]CDF72326.1 Protein of unknown function [Lactobacillus acidophilus CIRM-BIA 445]CDF74142.1 Protein of unknown function [Lactobacillus acidophilus DSM 9126]CDF76152.1 Protein of unknown function [Lactobacillus acidophilus DSM 20242]